MTLPRKTIAISLLLPWIALVLGIDRDCTLTVQYGLGLATWLLLGIALIDESASVRMQVLIAVAFATTLEYLAAPYLGFYEYRFDNVPAYVPPGHGLVYLGAIVIARSTPIIRRQSIFVGAALLAAIAWASWGVTLAPRNDLFGLLLLGLFILFVTKGGAPRVYAAAFYLTTILELLGTTLGNWTWAPTDPTGWIAIGNPPSGIAAAYCIVDWVALHAAGYAGRATIGLRGAPKTAA